MFSLPCLRFISPSVDARTKYHKNFPSRNYVTIKITSNSRVKRHLVCSVGVCLLILHSLCASMLSVVIVFYRDVSLRARGTICININCECFAIIFLEGTIKIKTNKMFKVITLKQELVLIMT